jgi:hypothetical protein
VIRGFKTRITITNWMVNFLKIPKLNTNI